MSDTPRARARERTMAEITRIGRDHLVRDGAGQLSLRAVARDLGVVSSAVYRYVADRDELLTLLVVDAYDELGEAVEEAVATAPDPRAQLLALGRATRGWALREPARYALLFGTPVPGYRAPADRTTAPGTRVVVALVGVIQRAHAAGLLREGTGVGGEALAGDLAADLAAVRAAYAPEVPEEIVARSLLVWAALFGAVSWEVFGQYGPGTVNDLDALFEHHLAVLAEMLGFN